MLIDLQSFLLGTPNMYNWGELFLYFATLSKVNLAFELSPIKLTYKYYSIISYEFFSYIKFFITAGHQGNPRTFAQTNSPILKFISY